MIVYVVSEDEDYNNYTVRAVFLDKEKAEKYKNDNNFVKYGRDMWQVEEHEVFE